jgi:predicted nucleotidyltransferase
LGSSVLRWPDRDAVDLALRSWAHDLGSHRPDVVRVGYFGSYARGDWGVGSDVDVIIVVDESTEPPHQRALTFDAKALPVPADLFVYTVHEWEAMRSGPPAMSRREGVWVYERGPGRRSE